MKMEKLYKVKRSDGSTIEITYQALCHDLGFIPEVEFVSITTRGTISFPIGRPHEIKALKQACIQKGYVPSAKLKDFY